MKRFRSTYIALGVLVLLGAYTWWTSRRPSPPDPDVEARRCAAVPSDSVEAVTWERPGEPTLRLVREGETWRLTEPLSWQADARQVDGLLAQLSDLLAEARYADSPDPAAYGLNDPVLTVRVEAGQETYTLLLGNGTPVGAGRYTMREGDPAVYVLPGEAVAAIDKLPIDLREKRVFPAGAGAVTRLELDGEGVAWSLVRDDDEWDLVRPFEDEADYWGVQRVLAQLIGLQAEEFVDEPGDPATYGLDEPAFRVALTTGAPPDEQVYRLEFGRGSDENAYYVRRSDLPGTLFRVPATALTLAEERAEALIHRDLFVEAWEDQVRTFTLTASDQTYRLESTDEGWFLTTRSGRRSAVDQGDVFTVLGALRAVSLTGVDAVGEPELASPDWQLALELSNGVTVSLSAREEGEEWPAAVEGRPHRYRVSAEALRALASSFAELADEGGGEAEGGGAQEENASE